MAEKTKEKNKSKNKITLIIPIVFIMVGLIVGVYPVVVPLINQAIINTKINDYDKEINNMSEDKKEEIVNEFKKYNETGRSNYYTALNTETIISYIDIPSIDIYLPIYKGTATETLDRGIGHLDDTSLPIGGKGSHCVLTGHSGLTTQIMFNNLEKVKIGDLFALHTYGKTLKYKVFNIITVLPNEVMDNIEYDKQHDYCTLVTCTPTGINSHRLLVQAERTSDDADMELKNTENTVANEATDKINNNDNTDKVNTENKREFTVNNTVWFCFFISLALEIVGIITLIRNFRTENNVQRKIEKNN